VSSRAGSSRRGLVQQIGLVAPEACEPLESLAGLRQGVLDTIRSHDLVDAEPHRWRITSEDRLAKFGIAVLLNYSSGAQVLTPAPTTSKPTSAKVRSSRPSAPTW